MGSEKKSKRRYSSSDSSSSSEGDEERSRKRHRRSKEDKDNKSSKNEKRKSEKSHKHSKHSHHLSDSKGKKSEDKHDRKRHKRSNLLPLEELTTDDYFNKSNEFATWLKEKKKIFFSDLSSEDARDLFTGFIKAWNKGKLEDRYYKGIKSGPRTAHNWKLPPVLTGDLH